MYGKYAGLEINRNFLRVCVLKRTLRDQKIIDWFTVNLEDLGSNLSWLNVKSLSEAEISTNIPTQPLSLRVLQFPFSDSKKIDQVYKFELENLTTFDPDEKLSDYHLIKRGEGSEALVCMFEKDDMEIYLEKLGDMGVDPFSITFSPTAFSALSEDLPDERPLLLVDISSNEMNFSLFDEHGLRRIRSSTNALNDFFANFDANNGSVDFEKLTLLNPDKASFDPLINEIARTAHFFETEIRGSIESVILSGDICNVNEIESYLSEGLGRKVDRIYIEGLGVKDSPFYAKSYALAQYCSQSQNGVLDLRKNEFEYTGKDREFRKFFLVPTLLLVLLIFLTFYRSYSELSYAKENVRDLQNSIQKELKEVFPNVSSVPDPVVFIESELSKVKEKLAIIEEVKGGSTPLDVMREISIIIPQNLNFKVDELRFETGRKVKLWGSSSSYKEIATVEQSLAESGKFQDVARDQVSRSTNNTVKFIISMVAK